MGFFVNMFLVFFVGKILERILGFLWIRIPFLRLPLDIFWRLGVVFHELSHFIIMKLLFIPVHFSDIDFHTRDGGGSIEIDLTELYMKRLSFFKDVLICVAPLWLGTCAIMEFYNMFVNNAFIGYKIISVGSIIIIMGAFVPSRGDMRKLMNTISVKPVVFGKQVIFLILAFLIYNLYFDFFYQFAPIYPYLFELFVLVAIEGCLELIFMILKFLTEKIFSYSHTGYIGFYNKPVSNVSEMFPSRKQRKRIKKMNRSELFTLLPYDDDTAAEEFAQSMIENNAMMIDIENPEDEHE